MFFVCHKLQVLKSVVAPVVVDVVQISYSFLLQSINGVVRFLAVSVLSSLGLDLDVIALPKMC